MSRSVKFGVWTLCLLASLVLEVWYVSHKEQHLDSKFELVKLTGLNSFAFYVNSPYLRHQFNHDLNDIFSYHPAFGESELGSFINSGYQKRFLYE